MSRQCELAGVIRSTVFAQHLVAEPDEMDWYSRKVLSWQLSNTLDGRFCVDCLEQALHTFGTPEIFNTDQGSQFTADAFTGVLKAHGISISMDGRGRALDNIFVLCRFRGNLWKRYSGMSTTKTDT